jgi:hypothetical protein
MNAYTDYIAQQKRAQKRTVWINAGLFLVLIVSVFALAFLVFEGLTKLKG